ncbi:hypothetical protein [Tepidibacter aestuarii]|uniref:hypothetical protein n=1 Tax=Tepidibacter aestuarii TaxID=2925782 RepID=UPI0020BED28E|nr:hypothetical protein [Tepidibacter aestuarii]
MDTIVASAKDYSSDDVVNMFLALFETSVPVVVVETLALAPTIYFALSNCKDLANMVDDLNDKL